METNTTTKQTAALAIVSDLINLLTFGSHNPDFDAADQKLQGRLAADITKALAARDARKLTKLCNHRFLCEIERIDEETVWTAIHGDQVAA